MLTRKEEAVSNATLDEREARASKENINRQRVQLDFSPEAFERLNSIRKMAEAKTNAEVIRNSLRVYEWFLQQKREGNRFQVVTNDVVKEVELLV